MRKFFVFIITAGVLTGKLIFLKIKMQSLIDFIKEEDPSNNSTAEIFMYPGFWAMVLHYPAHCLYSRGLRFLPLLISRLSRFLTGIDIHPGAELSSTVFIDHGAGVVLGETCKVGERVVIYQGVTLGGTGKDLGKRHPTIGNNVIIGAGAAVLGPITVGDNVKIGALAVVLEDVPAENTVVGQKARLASKKAKKVKV